MASRIGLIYAKHDRVDGGGKASRYWTVRTLVLQDGHLLIYPKKMDPNTPKSRPLIIIDLLHAKTHVLDRYKDRPNPYRIFRLVLPTKASFLFECPSDNEAQSWVDCINAEAETSCREKIMLLESEVKTLRIDISNTAGGYFKPAIPGKTLCIEKQLRIASLSHNAEVKEEEIRGLRTRLKVLTSNMYDRPQNDSAGRHARGLSWESEASSQSYCSSTWEKSSATSEARSNVSGSSSAHQNRPRIIELYARPSSGNWSPYLAKVDLTRPSIVTVIDAKQNERGATGNSLSRNSNVYRNSGSYSHLEIPNYSDSPAPTIATKNANVPQVSISYADQKEKPINIDADKDGDQTPRCSTMMAQNIQEQIALRSQRVVSSSVY